MRGEDILAGWRGGWGVNILEDARHSSVLYICKYFVCTKQVADHDRRLYFQSGAVMNQVPSILVLQYLDRFGVELEPDLEVKTLHLFVDIYVLYLLNFTETLIL